jgi:hypothetical protein
MTTLVFQRPVVCPCAYCFREINDPEAEYPSTVRGTPDKDWLTVQVARLSDSIDDEVSFGPVRGAKIPLCIACRDALIVTLHPDCVLDYRDGGSTPKIVTGREVC